MTIILLQPMLVSYPFDLHFRSCTWISVGWDIVAYVPTWIL